jgi:phosphatidylglycerol lysyltransferase
MAITAQSEHSVLNRPGFQEPRNGESFFLVPDTRDGRGCDRMQRPAKSATRNWVIALLVAAFTLASGLLNLFSVMGGPSYPEALTKIFPLEFIRLARTLTLLLGFALTVASVNIYGRKKRAWAVVLSLSGVSTIFHLARGHYKEAFVFLALVAVLARARSTFSVRSSVPNVWETLSRLAIAGTAAIGYGIAGFWFLDEKHFGVNFHIGDSIATTFRFLSLTGNPRLVPHTHYAHWFLNSLYVVSIAAVIYCGFSLFRPVIYHLHALPRERTWAGEIAQRYARTSLDYFKLWPDKSYFFSSSRRCFIAYRVGANVALALGDPVGPEEEIETTLCEFIEFCRDNGWSVGLHQTLPDLLPIYQQVHLKKLKIGDDALVDVRNFTLEDKSKKEFRYKVRQLEATGIHTQEYQPPVPGDVIAQLKEVSDEWLRIPGRRERRFTLGLFDPSYLGSTPVIAAVDKDDRILAFMNLISIPNRQEISMDLMRRRTDAPNGIMDYLFIQLFLYAKERGFERVNLGMAPMAGFQEREHASVEERAIHGFFQQLNFLFSFRGLRHWKAKFATSWEPRYMIYRNALDLPRLALALRRVSELKPGEIQNGRSY